MNKKVIIIAEAGVNHNGDYDLAIGLIDAAKRAGADFVKFQTFTAEKLVSKDALKAKYQEDNLGDKNSTQFEMLKKLELSRDWHFKLKKYSEEVGIGFMSSGFDEDSNDFLYELGVRIFKVPSGEIVNGPYLINIAKKACPVILSTGMANSKEIEEAVFLMEKHGLSRDQLTILHCSTEYPTPMEEVNLYAMKEIESRFQCKVGYSDHTKGIEVSIAAVALGARVIEKHFTLDRSLPGPDHLASLEPNELKSMVDAIRNIELAIGGDGVKKANESEKKNKLAIRKSLHYKVALAAGQVIEEGHLSSLRPGSGVSPMLIDSILGKRLKVSVEPSQILSLEDFYD